jgi:hypothetical protein
VELVARYLKIVGGYLPATQKDDIIKELSENIRSEVEDEEAELGRPLSEAEQEAVLKQHGHPLLVAGRYRQDHRSLAFGRQWIGPVLFPFYIKVLSFNLGLSFAIVFIVFVALFASGQSISFSDVVFAFSLQLIIQFAIVTLVFALLDKHLTKFPDRWDPRKAQELKYPKFLEASASKNVGGIPRLESISQMIASAVFLVWLRAAQKSPFLIFSSAVGIFQLAPVWHQVYAPTVLIIVMAMVQGGVNLLRPDWVRLGTAARLAMSAITLGVVYFLVRAGEWVVLASPNGNAPGNYPHALEIINQSVFYSLLFVGLIGIVSFLREFWRLVRPPQIPSGVSRVS